MFNTNQGPLVCIFRQKKESIDLLRSQKQDIQRNIQKRKSLAPVTNKQLNKVEIALDRAQKQNAMFDRYLSDKKEFPELKKKILLLEGTNNPVFSFNKQYRSLI